MLLPHFARSPSYTKPKSVRNNQSQYHHYQQQIVFKNIIFFTTQRTYSTSEVFKTEDPSFSNVTPQIKELTGRKLLHTNNHPLFILKNKINEYFNIKSQKKITEQPTIPSHYNINAEQFWNPSFQFFDSLSPVVTLEQNFDSLLTPLDHPSRKKDESYYLNDKQLLRCHMTAHQREILNQNYRSALFAGDVYRRDTVDATHYPVFHQLDGVRVFTKDELSFIENHLKEDPEKFIERDMKNYLEGLASFLFGSETKIRWVDAYFPFTHPSWEMEILFDPKDPNHTQTEENWLEVLGSGLIHTNIIKKTNLPDSKGWAFGLGLERWAMVLFNISDIRYFWSNDNRFLSQFENGKITKFVPYSKYPPCYKDITFWITPEFTQNNFHEMVRDIAGDIVESVTLIDQFVHPKTQKESNCYRVSYRSMDRTMTNEEVNEIHNQVRDRVVSKFLVELR